jgi:hypothetical protein
VRARVVVASPSTIFCNSGPLNYPYADLLNVRNHPKLAPSPPDVCVDALYCRVMLTQN